MDGASKPPDNSTTPFHVHALFDAWFSLNIIGGHFLVPILILTFLLSKAKRDATLINFAIILVLTSIITCLLLYTNEYLGPEPSKGLCIFQAAGFGASAPTWAVATLTLVVQMRSRIELKGVPWLFLMILMPYIVFIAFMALILVVGFQHPNTVTRGRRTLYCSLESRSISLFSICFTFVNCLIAFGLGASMCYQIVNILRMVRQVQRTQIRIIPLATRLLIFLAYIFFGLLTGVLSIWDRHTFARDIYTSTFSIAFFFVFGSQHDVLRIWFFWRKHETTTSSSRSAATADSGPLIFEEPVVPRNENKNRELPDTGETHEVRLTGSSPFSSSTKPLRAHSAVENLQVIVMSTQTNSDASLATASV